MSELPAYRLERTFDAPRELVWKTWTDPALLPRWYGPRDANWSTVPSPMMAKWPLVLLTSATFGEVGVKTKMTLNWTPHEASEAKTACFANAIDSLNKGWAAGMELLDALLAELRV